MEVNLPNFADLNNDKEVNGSNSRDGPLKQGNSFMLSDGRVTNSMPNQTEFVAALLEVQHANFTLEQLENKLAVGKVIRDVTFAFALYRKYASLKGFNVRVGRNEKSKDASYVIGKWFFCSCEGYTGNKRVIDKKSVCLKSSFRCGCEAKLKIGRKREEEWKVTRFDKQHNHDIYSEDQTYLLRSSRYVPDDTVELLNSMSKSRIATARAFDLFSDLAGGRENVGFTKKDADNALYRANRKAHLENRDSIELVQHFIKKTNTESNFYWNIEVDDDKRLLNFFFRDSRCRVDYELFGGVISFDTTYKTNKYDLICAPFVGINHHKENILFGVGFLSDETEYSFEWLFATFLESMGGQQPTCIFTDQCQSMMNAIPTSFPRAHHRLCQWHIDQNLPSHFGNLKYDKSFNYLWDKCLTGCETVEEFESIWREMMKKYVITDQDWFAPMYNLRHKWTTVYSLDIFTAQLLATSRSEGANSALKARNDDSTATLLEIVIAYEDVEEN